MERFDPTMQRRNYSAACPNCGGYAVVEDDAECWRCEATLTPGCPHCRRPVSLGGGLCSNCGETISHFELVRVNPTR